MDHLPIAMTLTKQEVRPNGTIGKLEFETSLEKSSKATNKTNSSINKLVATCTRRMSFPSLGTILSPWSLFDNISYYPHKPKENNEEELD